MGTTLLLNTLAVSERAVDGLPVLGNGNAFPFGGKVNGV